MKKYFSSAFFAMVLILFGLLSINNAMASDSGEKSPGANSPIGTGLTDPENAYTNNNEYAHGQNNYSSSYYNYGLAIPTGATIDGIKVRVIDAYRYSGAGNTSNLKVSISGDGGSTWSTVITTPNLPRSSDTHDDYTLGGSNNLWGLSWNSSNFSNSNFRVKVQVYFNHTGNSFQGYFDWLPVTVYYTPVPDTTPPIITLLGSTPLTIEAGSTYTDAGATALDNVDGDLTSSITTVNNVNTGVLGTYTVTYNVSDAEGNHATEVTRTVNVVDTTAPVITLNGGDMSLHTGDAYIEQGATVTDNLDTSLSTTITGTVDTSVPGTYVLHYNAVDNAGNHAIEVTRTVTVVDVSIPIITLLGDGTVTVEVGSTYTDAGATALDNIDGDLTSSIVTVNPVNTLVLGTYTITYNVSDISLNHAVQITRTVEVVDTIKPVITINGDNPIHLKKGDTYIEQGATATDNYDTSVTVNTTGTVNTTIPDTYVITYSATDSSGNSTSKTRDVLVRNLGTDASLSSLSVSSGNLEPIFDPENLEYTVALPFGTTENPTISAVTTDAFATKEITQVLNIASTNVSDRTATVLVTSEDTSESQIQQATYTVIFSVASLPDTTPPIITLNGSNIINLNVGNIYTDEGATAIDNLDGSVDVTSSGTVNTNIAGTYTITYNAVDSDGNNAIPVTRTVNITPLVRSYNSGGSFLPGYGPINTGSSSNTGGSSINTPGGQVLGASTFFFSKFLRRGYRGHEVTQLQMFLNAHGFDCGPVDGTYGMKTMLAIVKFQVTHNLNADGKVGPLTRAILNGVY